MATDQESDNNKLCAWRHNMQVTISSHLFARWHLFRHVGYSRHQQQVDLVMLKVMSESCVTWTTSVLILVFLGLSVLDLGPMYARDRQTDRRQTKASLNGSTLWGRGGGIIKIMTGQGHQRLDRGRDQRCD